MASKKAKSQSAATATPQDNQTQTPNSLAPAAPADPTQLLSPPTPSTTEPTPSPTPVLPTVNPNPVPPAPAASGTAANTVSIPNLPLHPLCELFPPMPAGTYEQFRRNIELGNRTLLIVWTHEGKIIDGRHTYRACKELGRQPDIREWHGDGTLLEFVVSQNLHIRHLSSSQRACLALDLEPRLAADAAARQQLGKADLPQKLGEGDRHDGESAAQAAKVAGTNREYVGQAKRLRTQWPEQFQQVRSGEIELGEATRLLREALQRLKIRSPTLHQQVLNGKRTLPQAERLAKRLRASDAPKPADGAADAGAKPVGARENHGANAGPDAPSATQTAPNPAETTPDEAITVAIVEVTVPEEGLKCPASSTLTAADESVGTVEPTRADQEKSKSSELTTADQQMLEQLKTAWNAANQAVQRAFLTCPSVRSALQRMGVIQ